MAFPLRRWATSALRENEHKKKKGQEKTSRAIHFPCFRFSPRATRRKPMEGLRFQTIVVLSRHTRKIDKKRRSPKSSTLARIRRIFQKRCRKASKSSTLVRMEDERHRKHWKTHRMCHPENGAKKLEKSNSGFRQHLQGSRTISPTCRGHSCARALFFPWFHKKKVTPPSRREQELRQL